MAKYIGTYTNSGAVQTALDTQELSRPFVAYTTDNDHVIYGAEIVKAEAGDIVVYATGDTLLHYIKQADYNTTSYPTEAYVPVGVVVCPQEDNVISGPTGEIKFLQLECLSVNNPDFGINDYEKMPWGYSNFDIPELTNCLNNAAAYADINGKANTEAVLVYATAQTNWRTDSTITWANEAGYYPLFECAWRYHTSGTAQGDWYIPAAGELYEMSEYKTSLEAGLSLVNGLAFNSYNSYNIAASTEVDKTNAWKMKTNDNTFQTSDKSKGAGYGGGSFSGRAFCSKLMTRI